jgi:hypothetical protein
LSRLLLRKRERTVHIRTEEKREFAYVLVMHPAVYRILTNPQHYHSIWANKERTVCICAEFDVDAFENAVKESQVFIISAFRSFACV